MPSLMQITRRTAALLLISTLAACGGGGDGGSGGSNGGGGGSEGGGGNTGGGNGGGTGNQAVTGTYKLGGQTAASHAQSCACSASSLASNVCPHATSYTRKRRPRACAC